MPRPRFVAALALLVVGCSEGVVVGDAPDSGSSSPPDNLDDWGGDRGSMMQSPGSGDFGLGEGIGEPMAQLREGFVGTDPPEVTERPVYEVPLSVTCIGSSTRTRWRAR